MGREVMESSLGSRAVFVARGKCSQVPNSSAIARCSNSRSLFSEDCRMRETAVHKIPLLHPLQLSHSLCTRRYLVAYSLSCSCLGRCPIRRTGICVASEVRKTEAIDNPITANDPREIS